MRIYIGIKDLVANAMIELLEHKNKNEISLKAITNYGESVIEILEERQTDAVLNISREQTIEFFYNNSQIFEQFCNGNDEIVRVKDNISSDMLWNEFRSYLSTEAILAFKDDRSIRMLGVDPEK